MSVALKPCHGVHGTSSCQCSSWSSHKKRSKLAGANKPLRDRNARLKRFFLTLAKEYGTTPQELFREAAMKAMEAKIGAVNATDITADAKARVEKIVREQVAKSLGFGGGYSVRDTDAVAKMKAWIDGIVKDEVRRVVIEHINIDMKISGTVHSAAANSRAMQLEGDHS